MRECAQGRLRPAFCVIPDSLASAVIGSYWRSGYRCSCVCWLGRRSASGAVRGVVVVSGTKKDVRLVYVLRDGSEYKVDGVQV